MSFSIIFKNFSEVLLEVFIALSPIMVLFLVFMLVFKLPKEMLIRLLIGVLFAFAGLVLFLQGVKSGFMPVGSEMGAILGNLTSRWVLIPLGFILGFVATMAEPAVRILSNQVEDNSSGYIRSNIILYTLCLAVGLFIALGMTRIVYGIPFYYIIIPGYLLAIILMIFSKPSFTAVAFDSGGVATGPMTVTFIMALAVGAADVMEGRDAVIDGFGLIALVALAPIIMVMLLGFLYPNEDNDVDENVQDQKADHRAHPEPLEAEPGESSSPEDENDPAKFNNKEDEEARSGEEQNDPESRESTPGANISDNYDEEGEDYDPDTKA